MAVPVILWGLLGAAALLALMGDDANASTAPGGGGGAPPGGGGGLGQNLDWALEVAPNGVIVVKKSAQAFLLGEISKHQAVVESADGSIVKLVPAGTVNPASNPTASQWMAGSLSLGRHVLMSITGTPYLRSCLPGQEVQLANVSAKEWAVLAETPATGGGGVPGIPGGGTATPGPTIPGSVVTPEGGVPEIPPVAPGTIPLPGGGGVVIPPEWGIPTLPGTGIPGLPGGIPGIPPGTIPGVPGAPGGPVVEPPTGDPYGFGSPYLYVIRPGDIASKIAQWYTGDFRRALELVPLNGLQRVNPGTPNEYFTPWNAGQVLKLPLTWSVAKGLPPLAAQSQGATWPGVPKADTGPAVAAGSDVYINEAWENAQELLQDDPELLEYLATFQG